MTLRIIALIAIGILNVLSSYSQDPNFPHLFSGDASSPYSAPFEYNPLCYGYGYEPGEWGYKGSAYVDFSDFCSSQEIRSNRFAVKIRGKWGYCDKYGNIIITPEYDMAQPFVNGMAAVCKNDKWGYIDINGNIKIPLEFAGAGSFVDNPRYYIGVAFVRDSKSQKCYLIDGRGKPINTDEYKSVGVWGLSKCPVLIGDKYGYIDKDGILKIEPRYEYAQSFNYLNFCTSVKLNGMWGIINASGEFLINPQFNEAPSIYNNIISIYDDENQKIRLYSKSMKNIGLYDGICKLSGSYIGVKRDGKWGVMNSKDGTMVTSFNFDNVESRNSNIICAKKDNKYGYFHIPSCNGTGFIYDWATPVAISTNIGIAKERNTIKYVWCDIDPSLQVYTKSFDNYKEAVKFGEEIKKRLDEEEEEDYYLDGIRGINFYKELGEFLEGLF